MYRNCLVSLPDNFGQKLSNLEILDISNNKLVELPESIYMLLKLKGLGIHNNKLVCLPIGLANLKSLEILCMTVEFGSSI